jgi:PBSX family phage terminase large subunit
MKLLPLTKKQKTAVLLARESFFACYEGAVSSGKTFLSIFAFIDLIGNGPEGPLLMAGRTLDTLRRNVVDPLTDIIGPENVNIVWGSGVGTILGRKVHLVGADNNSSESRIRGLTLAGAYVDEITIIGGPKGEEWFNMLLTRMRIKGARIIATTNPDSPYHWLLTEFLDDAAITINADGSVVRSSNPESVSKNVLRARFIIDDNKALDPGYITRTKASLSGLFYKRFIEGLWVAAEGAIYPMLEGSVDGKTIVSDLKVPRFADGRYMKMKSWVVGLDFGTTNPTHCVLLGQDVDGDLWCVRELRIAEKMLTVGEQALLIQEWLQSGCDGALQPNNENPRLVKVIMDPAAAEIRVQWSANGWGYPQGANNNVKSGIDTVATALEIGKLHISDSCSHLIKELTGYSWDPEQTRKGVDAPIKRDDHGPDALRYAMMFLAPTWKKWNTTVIENLDRVFTR